MTFKTGRTRRAEHVTGTEEEKAEKAFVGKSEDVLLENLIVWGVSCEIELKEIPNFTNLICLI
jgi:hypothetical protein